MKFMYLLILVLLCVPVFSQEMELIENGKEISAGEDSTAGEKVTQGVTNLSLIEESGSEGSSESAKTENPSAALKSKNRTTPEPVTAEEPGLPGLPKKTFSKLLNDLYPVLMYPLIIMIFVLIYGQSRRCPKCKRPWAKKTTHSTVISRWMGTKNKIVTDIHKNNRGDQTGTTEREVTVPAGYAKVRHWHKCKYCGYSWTHDSVKQT